MRVRNGEPGEHILRTLVTRFMMVFCTLGVASACDTEIDPFESTEMAFSIYGYLDPLADTQWIRVAPFRESIFSTPDPVDAVVTIEDLGTGRMIEMIPTLFSQGSGNFGDTLYAYNFQTTELIDHGATYRLTARRSDGASSSAVVEIPSDMTHLPLRIAGNSASVPIAEGDHVAMVNTLHFFPDTVLAGPSRIPTPCYIGVQVLHTPSTLFTRSTPEHVHGTFAKLGGVSGLPPCVGPYERVELAVARSLDPWPFVGSNNYTNFLAHNNIENGIGFLGGLVVNRVSLEGCNFVALAPGTILPTVCEVFVGRETARLRVRVVHTLPPGMGDIPFTPRVILQPAGVSWGRIGKQDPSWDQIPPVSVRFLGYLSGTYRVRVENPFSGPLTNLSVYCEERTIDLVPGDQQVEITLVRILDFPNEQVNANGCREGPP